MFHFPSFVVQLKGVPVRLHTRAISPAEAAPGQSASFTLASPTAILNTENLQEVSLHFCSRGLARLKLSLRIRLVKYLKRERGMVSRQAQRCSNPGSVFDL